MENINDLPLYKRLGIKEGIEIKLINEPDYYLNLLNGIASKLHFHKKLKSSVDLIHLFTNSRKELSVEFPFLKDYIKDGGAFFVSWPKNSANFICDLDEEYVCEFGKRNGFKPGSPLSIDDYWAALKFTKITDNYDD